VNEGVVKKRHSRTVFLDFASAPRELMLCLISLWKKKGEHGN